LSSFARAWSSSGVTVGEQITPSGARFDIQLKGPGPTPYSRRGDGRAALGPMLREFLISEAMHALGIPTTRSLAVVSTGEIVYRQQPLPGGILTRVAASHIRVGTFEWAAAHGGKEAVQSLADYTLQRHFPELAEAENRALALFEAVLERQAQLIARWQCVGFIHGVMNTDNMALSGETIDYGPCAFMDAYDPATVFSSIDHQGRYAYGKQPLMAQWNLARLAEALLGLFHAEEAAAVEIANAAVQRFQDRFQQHWLSGMRAKLGLFTEETEDAELIRDWLSGLQETAADFTNSFADLTMGRLEAIPQPEWLARWQQRLERQPQSPVEVREQMRRHNPAFIPRNHKVEEALAAAEAGDGQVLEKLLEVLAHPWDHERDQPAYRMPPDAAAEPYQTYCGT
jgi:uncharacterized protein YdiU (UPF0061 family)